jgi:hypothetical protein
VNQGGLEGLYRVLLSDSAEWFVAALRHIRSERLPALLLYRNTAVTAAFFAGLHAYVALYVCLHVCVQMDVLCVL